jgi:orotate phosphoribosyltransferase
MTALHAEGASCIGELLGQATLALPQPIHSVGGMVLGAAPLVTAINSYTASIGRPINGFLVRKEAKGHGGSKQLEGHLEPWYHVVLVEDVVTTGGSTLKAIRAIQAQFPSVKVKAVLALVDRGAGAEAAFAREGISLKTLFHIQSFLKTF